MGDCVAIVEAKTIWVAQSILHVIFILSDVIKLTDDSQQAHLTEIRKPAKLITQIHLKNIACKHYLWQMTFSVTIKPDYILVYISSAHKASKAMLCLNLRTTHDQVCNTGCMQLIMKPSFPCDFKWTIRLQSFVTHCLTQLQGYNLQRWAFSKQNWRLQQMLCCSHVITDESCAGTNRCCCMGFVPFGKRWRIFSSVSWRAGGSLNRPSARVCRMGPHRVMGNGVINNSDLP